MRAVRSLSFLFVLAHLLIGSLNAEAQVTPTSVSVPLQSFGGVRMKGGLNVNAGGEIHKSSRFWFSANEKSLRLAVTGYTLSLYPDRTGYATIYFGEEVTDSDYVQVRGEVITTGQKQYMIGARVTALRLQGVTVRP